VTQLAISGLAVEFGATRLLGDVTFTVARGERWGIIGRNGSGKTTLCRIISGETEPTAGTVARAALFDHGAAPGVSAAPPRSGRPPPVRSASCSHSSTRWLNRLDEAFARREAAARQAESPD
jgi:ATPase subunit of ABC transporter with duplicated ATPase domains